MGGNKSASICLASTVAFTNCDWNSQPPSGILGTKMPYKVFKRKPRFLLGNKNLVKKVHMIKFGPHIQSNLLLSKGCVSVHSGELGPDLLNTKSRNATGERNEQIANLGPPEAQ